MAWRRGQTYGQDLRERVDEVPDAMLAEHREWLSQTHGVVACLTTIWKTLKKLKLTRKKSRSGQPSKPARTWPKREQPGSPRSRGAPWRTIGAKIDMFSPTECTNCLQNCGYGHSA